MESRIPPYDASKLLTSWNKVDLKGRGSFACARKCVHSKLGNVVAKCFNITGSEEKCNEAMKEIEREVNVLFRLNHKNIVQMLGITQWKSNIGIIMECVDGGNLEDFLMSKDVPDIPLLLRLRFFYEIADGLSYMHYYDATKSFVHSDLKPQNILLTPDLTVKIADFGSVNVAMQSIAANQSLSVNCSIQHTIFYAAPEVLKDIMIKKKPSTDVYSFAMIGYEILTRHPVFQGVNHNRAVQAIIDLGQKPDVRILLDVEKSMEGKPQELKIFKFLESIIKKCWEFKPENRPDIRDVRNQINMELRSLAASTQSYDITGLKSQSKASDKSLITVKTQLNNFCFPYEEAPMPSSLQTSTPNTEISIQTTDVSTLSLQNTPLQPSKKTPTKISLTKPPLPPRPRKVQHIEKSDQQTRFALADTATSLPKKSVSALVQHLEKSDKQQTRFALADTATSIPKKSVSASSLEKTPTQPSRKVPAAQPQKMLLSPRKVQHTEKSDQQTKFALAGTATSLPKKSVSALVQHLEKSDKQQTRFALADTATSIPKKSVSALSLEKTPTQSSKKVPAAQPQKMLLSPRKVQHLEKSDEHQTKFALAENDQLKKRSETLIQQIKLFSTKEKWSKANKLKQLSLWVQLYKLEDPSLMQRAAKYFPSKIDLSEIDLNEIQVRAFSGILRFTNKFIEEIDLSYCQLPTSYFRHFSTTLLESKSTVGKLNICHNQLGDVKEILEIFPRIRNNLNLFYSFIDGRGKMRLANKDELKRMLEVLNGYNMSLEVLVAPITTLRSQRRL